MSLRGRAEEMYRAGERRRAHQASPFGEADEAIMLAAEERCAALAGAVLALQGRLARAEATLARLSQAEQGE